MKMRFEYNWSVLDPRPVLVYLPHYDDYIVYWNGIAMPHSMALCMAMDAIGVFSTPLMKLAVEKDYRRLYYAGALNTLIPTNAHPATMNYYNMSKLMKEHIFKVTENKDPKEILNWFDYAKANRESLDTV